MKVLNGNVTLASSLPNRQKGEAENPDLLQPSQKKTEKRERNAGEERMHDSHSRTGWMLGGRMEGSLTVTPVPQGQTHSQWPGGRRGSRKNEQLQSVSYNLNL